MKGGTTVKKDFLALQKMLGRPGNKMKIKCRTNINRIYRLTLREGSGKSLLLHGRQVVLGGTSDGHSEVSEAKTISDK